MDTRRIGRFELVRELGHGGMGVVYEALDADLRRRVAVKILRDSEHAEADDIARFRREARSAAILDHPNIVPVYEVGDHEGRPFYAMAFIDGVTLDAVLRDARRLPPRVALKVVRDAARALHYAHGRGVVHRDVKPANIMLTADGGEAPQDERGVSDSSLRFPGRGVTRFRV